MKGSLVTLYSMNLDRKNLSFEISHFIDNVLLFSEY